MMRDDVAAEAARQVAKRQDEQPRREVAEGVQDVERQPRQNPGQHPIPAPAEHQRLRRGVQNAEEEPVQRADRRVHDAGDRARHPFRQQHRARTY